MSRKDKGMTCLDCDSTKLEGTTGRCGTCNHARRKAEREANKVKVVKPIPKRTARRAAQEREYLKLRKQYMEAHPVCEVPECHDRAKECHHMCGRDGDKLTDTNYFLALCVHHHHKVTVDSKWAIEQGYSILRTTV